MRNLQWRLAVRPVGMPTGSNWKATVDHVHVAGFGEVVVKVHYISVDSSMRAWMGGSGSSMRRVAIGDVMRAFAVGVIVVSNSPRFAVGDCVSGLFGVQEYWVGRPDDCDVALRSIVPAMAPLPVWLNTLGVPGMIAYFGLLEVGRPEPGDTVVVSCAAGGVGQAVGQIALQMDCRVVGIAGGKQKCDFVVNELGFDACIDYRNESLQIGLDEACRNGVDVFFDNVGGSILDCVLAQINLRARIVLCGAISQYNNKVPRIGVDNYVSLLTSRARMEGVNVNDFANRYEEAISTLGSWLVAGKIQSHESVALGIENFPTALTALFGGGCIGKSVLQVS